MYIYVLVPQFLKYRSEILQTSFLTQEAADSFHINLPIPLKFLYGKLVYLTSYHNEI